MDNKSSLLKMDSTITDTISFPEDFSLIQDLSNGKMMSPKDKDSESTNATIFSMLEPETKGEDSYYFTTKNFILYNLMSNRVQHSLQRKPII